MIMQIRLYPSQENGLFEGDLLVLQIEKESCAMRQPRNFLSGTTASKDTFHSTTLAIAQYVPDIKNQSGLQP